MAIDRKLLEILCDPVTKVPVKLLEKSRLKILNEQINSGEVRFIGSEIVRDGLDEALITENDTTIYPVLDGIPVMLEDKGIATIQLKDF